MSTINDLYKESGITPGGFDRKPEKRPGGGRPKSLLLSIIISTIIFAGIFAYLEFASNGHSNLSMRSSGIFIVALVYVVSILVRVIRRLFNKMKD